MLHLFWGRASGLKNPLLHGGQYYLVKGCRCILGDQGSVLEILGPGGWRIGDFGPRWAQVGRVLGILGPGSLHDS